MRQSPITVRLWTDSINLFRHQICKSLVSVALKPQTAKPPVSEPTALPFPIRAVFEYRSEGQHWVFEPGVSYIMSSRGSQREDDPGPTKQAYNFASSLSTADGRGLAWSHGSTESTQLTNKGDGPAWRCSPQSFAQKAPNESQTPAPYS